VYAKDEPTQQEILDERMNLYVKSEELFVPWYFLAAVDQYERNIQQVRNDIPKRKGSLAIHYSIDEWVGKFNPKKDETLPEAIAFFGGNGLDGNGDGLADINSDDDLLFTIATYFSEYGETEEDFKIALTNRYERKEIVNQVLTIAKLYKQFETIDLNQNAFPLPLQHNYSYEGTWGASRGWGGRRIHEGTDLFASYGVPVQATSYGVIEVMGWNEYGGWRVGIRDAKNTYHYFAHLAYYNEGLKAGDIVEPGNVIGYVGSSGYGKEGTAGRFPPHLHYGMYKFNGKTEWAFDPFPSLRRWEKQDQNAK